MALFSLKARYIFPVHGPPIADGVVTIAGERIVSIGRESGGPTPIDLGNVAILPGLVNAHAHLEFSHLEEPLGEAGNSLPTWIDHVIAWRAAGSEDRLAAIDRGIGESVASGTALLGEIATGTAADYGAVANRIDLTLFRETIAPRPTDGEAALAAADQWLAMGTTATPDCRFGLNPHAPYTVHPHIVTQLAQRSAQQHVPLAMHVAESPEEVELLATGGGPLRELLEARSAWEPQTFARPLRPLDYLERIADADRSVVIHGNYLGEDELEFLAQRADRMALVFCPRTHAFFRHAPYPLAEALALGVRVAVGTDGRGSNPDLNLLSELCYVARHFPEVAPATVLKMGTLNGARALGRADAYGSISPGKRANLVCIAWPEQRFADPHEGIFSEVPRVTRLWHGGQPVE